MKKIKILTSIVGLSSLTIGLVPTIASCSCNNNGYSVELVSKVKERTFNSKTGGSAWTFKLADAQTAANTKVKLTNLTVDGAETQAVAGLIKYSYDSAGNIKVTVKTNTLLTQWPSATKFEFSFEFTNKVTKQTTTVGGFVLNIDDTLEAVNFCECEWSEIAKRTDFLYANPTKEEEFFSLFTIDGSTPITKWDDFIGLERSDDAGLLMNNQKHTVRVIGTNHAEDLIVKDGVVTDTPAIFTFELVTLLSDSSGNAMTTKWNSAKTYDYTNSILRYNLTGEGTPPTGERSDFWDTCALGLISAELQGYIKKVQKSVSTTSSYTITMYNDKLFPLTYTEMSKESEWAKIEGSAYKYWTNNETKTESDARVGRIKKDFNDNGCYYWLVSPSTDARMQNSLWRVYSNGNIYDDGGVDATNCVSFAFCI